MRNVDALLVRIELIAVELEEPDQYASWSDVCTSGLYSVGEFEFSGCEEVGVGLVLHIIILRDLRVASFNADLVLGHASISGLRGILL